MKSIRYRAWANWATATTLLSMGLGALDKTSEACFGISTGLGDRLILSGALGFVAVGAVDRFAPKLTRTDKWTPLPDSER